MSAAEPRPERGRERPGRRSPARFLAPLALVAVLAVVVIVVSANTGSRGSSDASSPSRGTSAVTLTLRPHRRRSAAAARPGTLTSTSPGLGLTTAGTSASAAGTRTSAIGASASATATSASVSGTSTTVAGTYTIAAGDTFAAVSAKTGVPIATIEQLNPRVSSSALTIGQVIKLR